MVKIILIKSPDEWETTKQTCRDELVVYLSFSSHNIYKYMYVCIYIYTNNSKTLSHVIVINCLKQE